MVRHLDWQDVQAIHDEVFVALDLDPAPLRDRGGLESAIMRPRMAEAHVDADLVRQATLLAIGISQAQAFVDGNKRAAFAALRVFLRINGSEFSGRPLELARQLELVAEREDSLAAATDRFEAWPRERVHELEPSG